MSVIVPDDLPPVLREALQLLKCPWPPSEEEISWAHFARRMEAMTAPGVPADPAVRLLLGWAAHTVETAARLLGVLRPPPPPRPRAESDDSLDPDDFDLSGEEPDDLDGGTAAAVGAPAPELAQDDSAQDDLGQDETYVEFRDSFRPHSREYGEGYWTIWADTRVIVFRIRDSWSWNLLAGNRESYSRGTWPDREQATQAAYRVGRLRFFS
jgi:hypothetical protein